MMTPWHRTAAFLLSTVSLLLGVANAQEPTRAVSYFDNYPAQLFFFQDTSSALIHDASEGNIYVSQDEGKTWEVASGIPKGAAAMLIEHPFENHYAFVLTNEKKHYRTADRGKTWREFEVTAPASYTATPLSFHSDPAKWGHIIYHGVECEPVGWGEKCQDNAFYTIDAFDTPVKLLRLDISRCQYAHSSKDFKHDAHENLIYCVGFDATSATGAHTLSSSRLFSSTDYFQETNVEDLGIPRGARGIMAFAIVSKFAVVALKDLSHGDMELYVTVNTKEWAQAHFPHASNARLRENAYTIVESTVHSLAVDVVLQDRSPVGTLFVSNSNGTYFVESLKDTNRNEFGFVDYENIYGVEGVGIANYVRNAQDAERSRATKQLRSMVTFDDGSSWTPIRAPSTDFDGARIKCDASNPDECSLHLHSVTDSHNYGRIFSSPAPGLVMGVGSIGAYLLPYEQCDTFLSIDAGLTWSMVRRDAHKYEFGDQGSIIVAVNDEEAVDQIQYSTNMGKSWKSYNFGVKLRARGLTTVSDSTSQKFVLLGQVSRQEQKADQGRYAIVFFDFADTRPRKCSDDDFEKWYARAADKECLMGHKQWYRRRKPDANCYVGEKFNDPVEHEENCACEASDFECDYNYVRSGDKCIASGREKIPSNQCMSPGDHYIGSSGYRLIPGNTCDRSRGTRLDEPVSKDCSEAEPAEGEVTTQMFDFPAQVVQYHYFKESSTILVRLTDLTVWQSSNEGYSWEQQFPGERFLAVYMHTHSNDRAYLITDKNQFYYTTDTGRTWNTRKTPTPPNFFRAEVLRFQPNTEYLIWTGNADCEGSGEKCHAQAQYSWNNGRDWRLVEDYVVTCQWGRDSGLLIDASQIICESYLEKQGSQRFFGRENPLQLISGTDYYQKKTKLFDRVAGFTKFSEFLIVAEDLPDTNSLDLQVSLDGRTFATGMFPQGMHPNTHSYTILESSTMSIFLHMTMTADRSPPWGNILKSNSNGTYFGVSLENVNRNDAGYVDFEKLIGLDGIAFVNIVANPQEAPISGSKMLQTRITQNDGGSWRSLSPPATDSLGRTYDCTTTSCALHIHGYTERPDARATYSSPSVVGVVMAVGNVGEVLAPYTDSDTFLSRDGGNNWEEVHKDAHLWEFGDSGSIIVIVNDEEPTDHVLFTIDEGQTWREFKFSTDKIRVWSIVTVSEDTSRKFILLGQSPRSSSSSVAIHIDFSALTHQQCVLSVDNPGHDDFEIWSPSEERNEACLFGRQTLYHRRVRDRNCAVGHQPKAEEKIVKNCACSAEDFECEFNYIRKDGECVLAEGMKPLPDDDSCVGDDDQWYERTAYRKIDYSSCDGGKRLDRGPAHYCPGVKGHSAWFWIFFLVFPFGLTALLAFWWYRRSGLARGTIRLPGDYQSMYRSSSASGAIDTIASVPWFLLGLVGIAWEYVGSRAESMSHGFNSRRGYRDVPVDEDAQILRFEDEE